MLCDLSYKGQGCFAPADLDRDRLTTTGRVDGQAQCLSLSLEGEGLTAATVKVDRGYPGAAKCSNFFAGHFTRVNREGDVIACHISITSAAPRSNPVKESPGPGF